MGGFRSGISLRGSREIGFALHCAEPVRGLSREGKSSRACLDAAPVAALESAEISSLVPGALPREEATEKQSARPALRLVHARPAQVRSGRRLRARRRLACRGSVSRLSHASAVPQRLRAAARRSGDRGRSVAGRSPTRTTVPRRARRSSRSLGARVRYGPSLAHALFSEPLLVGPGSSTAQVATAPTVALETCAACATQYAVDWLACPTCGELGRAELPESQPGAEPDPLLDEIADDIAFELVCGEPDEPDGDVEFSPEFDVGDGHEDRVDVPHVPRPRRRAPQSRATQIVVAVCFLVLIGAIVGLVLM